MDELFYRIEDKDGNGPYTYINGKPPVLFELTCAYYNTKEYRDRCPFPKNEGFPCDSPWHHLYGFDRLEQMKAWFANGEYEFLFDNGFQLYLVYGTIIHRSDHQVLFNVAKSRQRFEVRL